MKTTVEIDDELFRQAKVRAAQEGTSLRSVVEEALRALLAERERPSHGYRLPDRSVGGNWLRPQWRGHSLTDLIHEDYRDREQP